MTGNDLYYNALDLCGLRKPDGTLPTDIDDLTQRALGMINILLAENASLDGRIKKEEQEVSSIAALTDSLDISDIVAKAVLPFGLARLLIIDEDVSLAASFQKLYEDARAVAIRFGTASVAPITEVYQ